MRHIYRPEFLEQFKAGEKEFSDIHLQFCELEGIDLSGLVIKNSKIEFTYFRNSKLKDARFVNCDMFFVSFYGCDVEHAVFENCRIDITRIDNMLANGTKIINSNLSFCGFMGTNIGEIDFRGTREFKVIRTLAELTTADALEAVRRLGMHADALPIEAKIEVKNIINTVMNEFNQQGVTDISGASAGGAAYKTEKAYSKQSGIYGALDAIGAELMKYGDAQNYQAKDKSKEKPDAYRSKGKY